MNNGNKTTNSSQTKAEGLVCASEDKISSCTIPNLLDNIKPPQKPSSSSESKNNKTKENKNNVNIDVANFKESIDEWCVLNTASSQKHLECVLRRIIKKQARKNQNFTKQGDKSGKVKEGPIIPSETKSEPENIEVPIPVEKYCVIRYSNSGQPSPTLGEDSELVIPISPTIGRGVWTETRYSLRLHNPEVFSKQISPGYYTDEEGTSPNVSPFRQYKLPEQGHVWAMPKAILLLRTAFPTPALTESNLKGFQGMVAKNWPKLTPDLQADSVRVFVHQLGLSQTRIDCDTKIRQQLCTPQPKQVYESHHAQNVNSFLELDMSYDINCIRRLDAVPNNVFEVSDNKMFTVTKSKGFTLLEGHSLAGNFDTPHNDTARNYQTVMLEFVGDTRAVVYDKSGQNVSSGLGRLYKNPDNGVEKRAMQVALSDYLTIPLYYADKISNKRSRLVEQEARQYLTENKDEASLLLMKKNHQIVGQFIDDLLPDRSSFSAGQTWYFLKSIIKVMCEGVFNFILALFDAVYARLTYAQGATKSALYLQYFYEWLWHSYEDVPVANPEAKVKIENGKVLKMARLYITYGSQIIAGGWIFEFIKAHICRVLDFTPYGQGSQKFGGSLTVYKKLLSDEWDPVNYGYHARGFSDDVQAKINFPNGTSKHLEIDISACDGSVGYSIAILVYRLAACFYVEHIFVFVMAALRVAIKIVNPSNTSEWLYARPVVFFMGSGSPGTTLFNNLFTIIGQLMIYICMSRYAYDVDGEGQLLQDFSDEKLVQLIKDATAQVGMTVTVDVREHIVLSGFLKESLFTAVDRYGNECQVAALQLGAILRSLGKVHGDLDGRMLNLTPAEFKKLNPAERMQRYMSGVIAGYCHEPSNIILDALRARFPPKGFKIDARYQDFTGSDRSSKHIEIAGLVERYGGSDSEWEELALKIRDCELGHAIRNQITRLVLSRDYGL